MNKNQQFDLQASPIRKNLATLPEGSPAVFDINKDDPYFDTEAMEKFRNMHARDILADIENMLDTTRRNAGRKTSIAVMGEVKAGKSTFINACLGKTVAYTDVLEATALVSEIVYSVEEYVHVLGWDGSVKMDMSFDELMDWMEEQVDEEADFSEYSKIEVGVDSPLLKNASLVDTPGLLSITSANHDMTHQYIAQTDFVLWSINSRDLGSSAVNEYIQKIRSSGKPMIGIITKVDTPEVRAEIEDYVQEQYGNVFEDIFYVSSLEACRLREAGDPDWAKRTGFEPVLECIADIAEDKDHSVLSTRYYQLQREQELHRKLREIIRERKEFYERELSAFGITHREISQAVSRELRRWLDESFYQDEKAHILEASDGEVEALFRKYGSNAYLNEQIRQKYNKIIDYINQTWNVVIQGVSIEAARIMVDFSYHEDVSDLGSSASQSSRAESMKKGMKHGACLGVALAGCGAFLGEAAATSTIISTFTSTFAATLLPTVIPFAIAGAAVGMFWNAGRDMLGKESSARKRREMAEQLLQQAVAAARKNLPQMEKNLIAYSAQFYRQRYEFQTGMVGEFNFDFNDPPYSQFMSQLDSYIAVVDAAAAACREDAPPPEME